MRRGTGTPKTRGLASPARLLPALACLAGLPFAAGAQTRADPEPPGAAADDGRDPEDVVVTARRLNENSQRIPVAVTVVGGDQLDPLAINTPLDLNKVAGLGGAPIGSLTSVNFTIRGQGAAFGGQPGVIPYFAEVPNFPLAYYDLQSVQVIKGPQGTLFGQTSTGGVVLFEPRRPTDRLAGSFALEAGSHAYRQAEGVLNLPVAGNTLLARIAFQVRKREGWGRGLRPDGRSPIDLNNLDNESVRVSLLWKPTGRFENLLIYAHDDVRNNGNVSPLYYADARFMNPAVRDLAPSGVPSLAAAWQFWTGYAPPPGRTFSQLLVAAFDRQRAVGPLTMFTDYGQRNRTVNEGWINQTTWDVPGLFRVRNIFGLRYSTSQGAVYDQDATDLPLLDFQCRFRPGAVDALSPCAKVGGWPDRTFSDELQVQGDAIGGRLRFQGGLFYQDSGSRRYREDSRPFIVFGQLTGDPASAAFCASVNVARPCSSMSRSKAHSYAAFGQVSYAIRPDLRLTAGLRETWDYARTDTTGKSSYLVPFLGQQIAMPVYGGAVAAGATVTSTVVDLPANSSYNVSADWQVGEGLLIYAAHRSGYKSGGINAVANPGTPQRSYGPERAKDIEVGIKADWRAGGSRGRVNLAAYHTWYGDIQEGEIIPGTAQTVTTNLANARIDGVELEGFVEPVRWFRLDGSVAFTDARYTKWTERSSCAAQYWRPQCAALAPSTEIRIDHAAGRLDIGGTRIDFAPDRFANTSRWQWSIRPSVDLRAWTGEAVTLSLNFYGRSPYVDAVAVANTSKLAGVPANPQPTVFGTIVDNPYDAPGYALTDVRVDWRRIRGSRVSAAAGVTNLANRIYRVSSASAFEIIGDAYTLIGEPRMAFLSLKLELGRAGD